MNPVEVEVCVDEYESPGVTEAVLSFVFVVPLSPPMSSQPAVTWPSEFELITSCGCVFNCEPPLFRGWNSPPTAVVAPGYVSPLKVSPPSEETRSTTRLAPKPSSSIDIWIRRGDVVGAPGDVNLVRIGVVGQARAGGRRRPRAGVGIRPRIDGDDWTEVRRAIDPLVDDLVSEVHVHPGAADETEFVQDNRTARGCGSDGVVLRVQDIKVPLAIETKAGLGHLSIRRSGAVGV